MTQVDFYKLDSAEQAARHHIACRLTAAAWHKGHRVYLHASDETEATQLDQLLWSWRDSSFLPHSLFGAHEPPSPIEIGSGEPPASHNDVLLNLAPVLPHDFTRFARISEIVLLQDTANLAQSREHWRAYQRANCTLNDHDIPRSQLITADA